jgi:hypothetical protein
VEISHNPDMFTTRQTGVQGSRYFNLGRKNPFVENFMTGAQKTEP